MTIAEIQQAVGANPALLGEIATTFVPEVVKSPELIKGVLPIFTQNGYVVRSQADETSYLETYKNTVIEKEIPTRIKEVHDRYDQDIFDLTGEKKQPNEKTYDFLKRKITEIKNSKVDDPTLRGQLEKLQKDLLDKDNVHKEAISKMESGFLKDQLTTLVTTALDVIQIAIPAHLKTPEEKGKYEETQRRMMKRDMLENITGKKDAQGNVIFYEGETPLTSTADGKPLKALDIINSRYSSYIAVDPNRKQAGAGSGLEMKDGKPIFTTKQQAFDFLVAKGMDEKTKAFTDEYAKLVREHALTA
jgi:hypothetical protein